MKRIVFSAEKILVLGFFLFLAGGCKSDESPSNGGNGGGNTPTAKVMVVHGSPGSPAIDLYVDTSKVRSNVAYPGNTGYLGVAAGLHNLKATIAGTQTVLVSQLFPVPENIVVTAFAADTGATLTATAFVDTFTTPASGKAAVRYINMMPRTSGVTAFLDGSATAAATLDFLAGTAFVTIDAGTHTIQYKSGSTVLAALTNYNFQAGKVYSAWLRGLNGTTGTTAPGVEVIIHN